MQALRVIKEPHNHQVVVDLPPGLSTAARVEVIVFAAEEDATEQPRVPQLPGTPRRRPSPRLAATRITGDLMSPAVPEADWNALT